NLVGLAVVAGISVWAYYYMPREEKDFIELGLPWPAALLPFLGPMLLILLLLKLFQPKRTRDFWALQAIAMMAVALGCVLSSDTFFGLLLAGYVATAMWNLALHHLTLQQLTSQQRNSKAQAIPDGANFAGSIPDGGKALFARTGALTPVPWRRV